MQSRRSALKLLGLSAVPLLAQLVAQPGKGKRPPLCVLSSARTGVGYAEIGEIVKQLGFEGVDITMMRGGLVEPQLAPVDEVRAFESIHGAGLAAPIATSALKTPNDPWCRTVLALAGRTGVGLCKIAAASRREVAGLAYIGREYSIAVLTQASATSGLKVARDLLTGLDPAWSGLSLHSDLLAAGSGVTDDDLRDAMPQVKAVTVADRNSQGAKPLGQGSVNFDKLFTLLARAGFSGPITVDRTYQTVDEPGALIRDAEFVKTHLEAAYGAVRI